MQRRNFLKAIAVSIVGLFVAKPILAKSKYIHDPEQAEYIVFKRSEYIGEDGYARRSIEGYCNTEFLNREQLAFLSNIELKCWRMESETLGIDAAASRMDFRIIYRENGKRV